MLPSHTTFRCVGVIGGVFVCMGYAVKITTHAVDVVTGADKAPVIVAEASGVRRKSFFGGDLHKRGARSTDWGSSLTPGGSPYASYAGSPAPGSSFPSPYLGPTPGTPAGFGLGLSSPGFGPASPAMGTAATAGSPYAPSAGLPSPYTPSAPSPYSPSMPSPANKYAHFPPTPNPANGPGSGVPSASAGPPPRRENGHHPANGAHGGKKDD